MNPNLGRWRAGALARPEMPEVVHVLGVSGAGRVREVTQRAPIISQPLADFPVPGVDILRIRRGVPVVDDEPRDVGERLVQRARLSRIYMVAAPAAVGCTPAPRLAPQTAAVKRTGVHRRSRAE